MKKAIPLLLLLAGCNSSSADSRYINQVWADLGGKPQAKSTQTQPYGAQGSITLPESKVIWGLIPRGAQKSPDGAWYFAQRQSRRAITSRIGFARYEEEGSGRYDTGGGGNADILYDSSGYAIAIRQHTRPRQAAP